MISVAIYASHPIAVREYGRVLRTAVDFQVVETTQALDVAIFDHAMNEFDAAYALVRSQAPSVKALVIGAEDAARDPLQWLLRGFCGMLGYSNYEESLCDAVRYASKGQLWFPISTIRRWFQMESPQSAPSGLSARENEVLELVAQRLSNKEIATLLKLSEHTIKFHVGNILRKLKLKSRQDCAYRFEGVIRRGA